MPRRSIPRTSLPHRPDLRRPGGNAIDAQRPARRGRRGEVERIAERRTIALELRKAGGSYREIARQLGVDVHTAHADVGAELAALRETAVSEATVSEATELRTLELERLDGMTSVLWPGIQEGSAAAVSAGVRVSERRARLLGLDAPAVTKNELTGSVGVYAERLAAERELFSSLSIEQLEELAAESQALVDKAMALARANASPMLVGASPSPDAGVDDYAHLYAETEFRFLMRQTTDPVILVGPLAQSIRGALFGFVFYLLREPLFSNPRGWLLMWALLVIIGIIGTFGPAPGSIEGMIYTILPIRLQLIGMPEVLLQSFALSVILFYWVRNPERRWVSWVLGAVFVGIVLVMTMAIISSR